MPALRARLSRRRGASGFGVRVALGFLPAFVSAFLGCGGGAPAPAGPAATLLRPLAAADSVPAFTGGGAPGDLLVRCGTRQARLKFGNETVGLQSAEAFELLAAWRDPKSTLERWLGPGADAPLFVEGGQAYALPGWPAGATVVRAAFSPDGRHLAIGLSGSGLPGSLGIWPVPLGAPQFLGGSGGAAARLLAWSGDGRTVAMTDADNVLSIYRLPGGKPVYRLAFDPGTEGRVSGIDLSPDGDWYVAAANAVILRAWKLPFMNTQLAPWGGVKAVFFAGEVGSIVTVDETNTAIRWAVNYGNVRVAVSRHLAGIDRVQAPAAGQYFAGVDSAGVLHGWRSGDLESLLSDAGDQPFCR